MARQEYEQILSSVDNTEQTVNLRVEKIKQEANARKKDIQIRLSNIKIMNEAQSDKVKCIDQLYNDIKEISLKLGDGSR